MRYFLLLMNPCLRLIVQRDTRSHKIFIVGRFKDSYIGALAYSYTGVENAVNHCSGMWSLAILSLTQWNSSMIWFDFVWEISSIQLLASSRNVVGVFEKCRAVSVKDMLQGCLRRRKWKWRDTPTAYSFKYPNNNFLVELTNLLAQFISIWASYLYVWEYIKCIVE